MHPIGLHADLVRLATARAKALMAPRFTRAPQSRRLCGANLSPPSVSTEKPSRRTAQLGKQFQASRHPGRSHEGECCQEAAPCLVLRGLIPKRLRRKENAALEADKLTGTSDLDQRVESVRHRVEKLLIGNIDALQEFW